MRLQSSLGDHTPSSRLDVDNSGKLSLARVVKVYQKTDTADVVMLNGAFIGDNNVTDGEISCVHIQPFSGWDDELQVAYGDIVPIEVGQIVVIGYIDSMKSKPIIIGSLPQMSNSIVNSPVMNAGAECQAERGERISVNRYQDYSYMNGEGEFEKVSNSRSFIVGKKEKMSDHRENAFSYEDLTLKNKFSMKTIGLMLNQFFFKPFNYLITTRNQFLENNETTYNRIYHDAETGVTRLTKDSTNRLFMIEIDEDDNFEIRMQPQSFKRRKIKSEPETYFHNTLRESDAEMLLPKDPREEIPPHQKVEEVTKFKIHKDGKTELLIQGKENVTRIEIGEEGLKLETTEAIDFKSNKRITMRAPEIDIHEHSVDINYEDIAEKDDENEWERQWVEPTEEDGV